MYRFVFNVLQQDAIKMCLFNGGVGLSMCSRHIQDPASQRLTWNKPPVNVLVIRKIRDESLVEPFKELCRFLVEVRNLVAFIFKTLDRVTKLLFFVGV